MFYVHVNNFKIIFWSLQWIETVKLANILTSEKSPKVASKLTHNNSVITDIPDSNTSDNIESTEWEANFQLSS